MLRRGCAPAHRGADRRCGPDGTDSCVPGICEDLRDVNRVGMRREPKSPDLDGQRARLPAPATRPRFARRSAVNRIAGPEWPTRQAARPRNPPALRAKARGQSNRGPWMANARCCALRPPAQAREGPQSIESRDLDGKRAMLRAPATRQRFARRAAAVQAPGRPHGHPGRRPLVSL